MERVRASRAYPSTVLEFLVLTSRGARWEEMDLEAREWRVPQRMKTTDPPGSLVQRWRCCGSTTDLVFPSVRGRPLSDATIVRELGIGAVPHGFR